MGNQREVVNWVLVNAPFLNNDSLNVINALPYNLDRYSEGDNSV